LPIFDCSRFAGPIDKRANSSHGFLTGEWAIGKRRQLWWQPMGRTVTLFARFFVPCEGSLLTSFGRGWLASPILDRRVTAGQFTTRLFQSTIDNQQSAII
jgi:hypothetical protein